MKMQVEIKKLFFDRRAVTDAIGRAEAKNLSKIGAYLRTRARSLQRRRKAASSPGQPPSVHSRDSYATLRNIQFYYDQGKHSVITGPIKFNTPYNQDPNSVGAVPGLQEFGGQSIRTVERWKGRDSAAGTSQKWFAVDSSRSRRRGRERKQQTMQYPKRPFMEPALRLEIAAGTIRDVWRNSVTPG